MVACGPFEDPPRLAVGVSGGVDSMALAHLAAGWAARRAGDVTALVVDHGLRAGSPAEARDVVARLAAAGIAAAPLTWGGPPPATGIQAAAREARRALLTAACRERGILHLLLAHHRDDQAETVAMRRARGSGRSGLAGMAGIVETAGLRMVRPLLPLPRARLIATAGRLGLAWIDDPTNRDPRFARSRLRADAGPMVDAAEITAAGRGRAELERNVAAKLARHLRPHPLGFARLDAAAMDDVELAPAVWSALLTTIGGRHYPPSRHLVERLAGWDGRRRSIGGCLVRAVGGSVEIVREAARITDVRRDWRGEPVLWDGRWRIVGAIDAEPLTIRSLGHHAFGMARPRGVPAAAAAALPALWRGVQLTACLPNGWVGGAITVCGTAVPEARVPAAAATFMMVNVVSNRADLI